MLLIGNLLLCLTFIYFYARHFMPFVENREDGFRYTDRILEWIHPKDCSVWNAVLLYLSAAACAWDHIWSMETAVQWVQVHTMFCFCRMFCLFMIPLLPPNGYIPMRDPLVDWATGSTDEPLSRDLLPSGHCAFVTANFMMATSEEALYIHGICMVVIPILLLVQHVHYTIDVFVAYFIAFASSVLFHPAALDKLVRFHPYSSSLYKINV